MTIYTVTISARVTEVYGGLVACDAYLADSIGAGPDAYNALTPDERSKRLIAATRWIDQRDQIWKGTPTTPAVDGTVLKWPRTGVTYVMGSETVEVDPDTVPADLVEAVFELAALVAADQTVLTAIDQSQNIQSLAAGSASISYFGATSVVDGTATKFPLVLENLLAKYRRDTSSSAAAARGGRWFGSNCESHFDDCGDITRIKRTEPF